MSIPRPTQVPGRPQQWSSGPAFAVAAVGSAVGLGNLWDLPHLAGRHGGGAFVLVYAASVMLVAGPLLAGELIVGRRARRNPVDAMAALARCERRSRLWQLPAWLAVAASLLTLAIYGVLGGWAAAYLRYAVQGELAGGGPVGSARRFSELLASPATMAGWNLLLLSLAALIAAAGIRRGVERATRWLVPAMLAVLILLLIHAAARSGRFVDAAAYLLKADFARLDGVAIAQAFRHACFTLSLGVGVMTAYGAYLPDRACIPRLAFGVAAADLVASLIAALAILPVLMAAGIRPVEGPALAFVALPAAIASVPGGGVLATLFFLLLVLASLTSAVALIEPAAALAVERLRVSRVEASFGAAGAAAAVGVLAVLALNEWANVLAAILLPLAAGGTALFAGHVLTRRAGREELGLVGRRYRVWLILVRWAAPAGIGLAVLGLRG